MEKSTLITGCTTQELKEPSHRKFFSELFPQSNSDYNRNRYQRLTQKLSQQKSSNANYVTFKCQVKKSDSKYDKENSEKLPMIYCPKKPALVDKYFSRNDIVKDRSQQKSMVSSKYFIETTINQPNQNNKYKKVISRTIPIERMSKSKTIHNKKTLQTIGQKSMLQEKPHNLQQQMKQLALIKKKNEYEVFKLIRKNNYQRMKSNMIIAQAMKQLLDKREELLGKEETQKETVYLPLDQSDTAELQK